MNTEQIYQALWDTHGNVWRAARQLQCSPAYIRSVLRRHPELVERLGDRAPSNKRGRRPVLTEQQVIDALQRCEGSVVRAAKDLNHSHTAVYTHLRKNPELWNLVAQEDTDADSADAPPVLAGAR